MSITVSECIHLNMYIYSIVDIFTYQAVKRSLRIAGICRQCALGVLGSGSTAGGPGAGCAAYWVSLIRYNPRGRYLNDKHISWVWETKYGVQLQTWGASFCIFPLVCFIFHTFTQFVAIQNVQNSQTAFYLIYVQINLYRQNSGPEELSQRKILWYNIVNFLTLT